MVHLAMRMEYPLRVLLIRPVIAQDDVHLIAAVRTTAYNRRYRVMRNRLSVLFRERQNLSFRITVGFPLLVQIIGSVKQHVWLMAVQAQHGHGPIHDGNRDTLERLMPERRFRRSLLQREGMSAPLEMVMRQDRPANDRQVRIGADEIMRELCRKIQQTLKGIPRQLHRHMIMMEDDAMLIVVYVRRVLKQPRLIVQFDRNHPQILPCRVINSSGITYIFPA
ncbi:hypothetical protein D3C77_418550 [compost metagenome]